MPGRALLEPFPAGSDALLCWQMAVLEIQGNGESSYVPQEAINSAIQLLEDPLQRVSRGGAALSCSAALARCLMRVLSPGVHSEVSGAGPRQAPHGPGAAVPPGALRGALAEALGCSLHRGAPA